MHPFVGLYPLPVEIEAGEIGSEVAVDNPVGVDHGYRYNFVLVEQ